MQIKFMTYNVWFREDVVVYKRMQAIGRLVEEHRPDVIFFLVQENTLYTQCIFESFAWWKDYQKVGTEIQRMDKWNLMVFPLLQFVFLGRDLPELPCNNCYPPRRFLQLSKLPLDS